MVCESKKEVQCTSQKYNFLGASLWVHDHLNGLYKTWERDDWLLIFSSFSLHILFWGKRSIFLLVTYQDWRTGLVVHDLTKCKIWQTLRPIGWSHIYLETQVSQEFSFHKFDDTTNSHFFWQSKLFVLIAFHQPQLLNKYELKEKFNTIKVTRI